MKLQLAKIKRRSPIFWILTIGILCYAISHIFMVVPLAYQIHFGETERILSQTMSAEAYADLTIALWVYVVLIVFSGSLAAATTLLLLKKYAPAEKLFLLALPCGIISLFGALFELDLLFDPDFRPAAFLR